MLTEDTLAWLVNEIKKYQEETFWDEFEGLTPKFIEYSPHQFIGIYCDGDDNDYDGEILIFQAPNSHWVLGCPDFEVPKHFSSKISFTEIMINKMCEDIRDVKSILLEKEDENEYEEYEWK